MSELKLTHAVFNETTNADVSQHVSAKAAEEEADRLRRYHSAPHFQVRSVKESDKEAEEKNNYTLNEAPGDGTLSSAPTTDSLTQGAKQADLTYKDQEKFAAEAAKRVKESENKK